MFTNFATILFVLTSILIHKSHGAQGSPSKLESYTLTMEVDANAAGHTADIHITVFWNNEVYEATINSPATTASHKFLAVDTFNFNDWNEDPKIAKAKMLIQNKGNPYMPVFTSLKLVLEDGSYYGAKSFCGDKNILGPDFTDLLVADGLQCPIGLSQYRAVIADPSNLMVYFDKRYPNELIDNAILGDAGQLFVEGCQMVVTPNNARKCARKDVKTCERTNFCTLVRYEVGEAEGPHMDFDKEMIAASKIYKIKYKVPQRIIPQNALFVLIAVSVLANLYFCFGGYTKNGKFDKTEITPLLKDDSVNYI